MSSTTPLSASTSADDHYRQLVESIDDHAIYMLDLTGHVITWNIGAERNKGYTFPEVRRKHFRMFFVPEDVMGGVPERNLLEAKSRGRCSGEGWRLRKNGERFWASFTITGIRDSDGRLIGFAKITRDMTEKKCQEEALVALELALREERDTLRAACESATDALFICEALRAADGEIEDFIFTQLHGKVEELISIPREKLLGGRLCELFTTPRQQGLFEKYKSVVATGEPLSQEFPVDEENVMTSWMRVQVVKLRDGIAITASNITERKRIEAQIIHIAHHDHLTGLPNRSLLQDRLDQAIERTKRNGGKVAVLTIDLDGFKAINDTHGHAIGDGVLVTVGVRLRSSVRATDTVIRLGGDEFVVVMPEIRDDSVLACAQKVLRSLQESMEVEGHMLRITCSVGVAVYPDTAVNTDELLTRSDAAMYSAKRRGKNQIVAY
jgi:diguanylate cyclase (GGDEF)-like protein/PAS domain S-box-containing protein